jgi:hypothetical protein
MTIKFVNFALGLFAGFLALVEKLSGVVEQ